MRRILALAALSTSLIGLAACSGGSSSAIPTTSAQAGTKGGLVKFDNSQNAVEVEAGTKGGLVKFAGTKGGLQKFAGTKGGLNKF